MEPTLGIRSTTGVGAIAGRLGSSIYVRRLAVCLPIMYMQLVASYYMASLALAAYVFIGVTTRLLRPPASPWFQAITYLAPVLVFRPVAAIAAGCTGVMGFDVSTTA